jgi:hypothetical protein
MGRPVTWTERIPAIRRFLESDTADCYTRADVQRILGLSEARARVIVGKVGYRAGGVLKVTRKGLLDYMTLGPEAQEWDAAEQRRPELEQRLAEALEEPEQRKVVIRDGSKGELAAFRALADRLKPADLDVVMDAAGGVFEIHFEPGNPTDFVEKLFAVGMAVRNEMKVRNDGRDAERLLKLLDQFQRGRLRKPRPVDERKAG